MLGKGEIIDSNYTSSIENLQINDWTKIQMTKTLELLNGKTEGQPSFYSIEGEKVIYNMNLVIEYLTHLCKKKDGTLKTWKEMTDDIWAENIEAGNEGAASTLWIMAVEITLEYLGYDVGKIDGNLGIDTKKIIRKYQKDNKLQVDGQPRPEVIEKIIIEVDEFVNHKKSIAIVNKLTDNYNSIGIERYTMLNSCFSLNKDGTISFKITDGLLEAMEPWFLDLLTDIDIQFGLKTLNKSPIEKLFEGVIKPGEYIVIEYTEDGIKKRFPIYSTDATLKYSKNNTIQEFPSYPSLSPNYIITIMGSGSVKIIPQYLLGYDSYFLQKKRGNGMQISGLEELWGLGITMADSKDFIDKYIEVNKIKDIKNIDVMNFFNEELKQEMINFLFGEKSGDLKGLLPITISDGLKLYYLKNKRGEYAFKKYIVSMVNNGILNNKGKYKINKLIESKITKDKLPEYLILCDYLDDIPDLHGYTPQEYLIIVKYMDKYDIPRIADKTDKYDHRIFSLYGNDNILYENMKISDMLLRNNIPGEVYHFISSGVSSNEDINEPCYNKIKELFIKNDGLELYFFLSKYPQKLKNLGGKEIKEIELTTKPGGYNFCFRGILEMIKSIPNIEIPNFKKDGKLKWKQGRERIIKEYENLLRNYISLDKDENGNEIPRKETFDKIFFASGLDHPDEDWNGVTQGENKIDYILKNFTENFEDCSNVLYKNGDINQSNQKYMIEKIRQYANTHQNEKILVCIDYHGGKDGSSSNGWKKEDRENLAKISPNIKIMSSRCHFGAVYNNENPESGNYIYSIQSPTSGFSNNISTHVSAIRSFKKGYKNGLGFHEIEIYARLYYDYSFSPLTEYMDYIDFRTGKKRRGLVGLADAGMGNGRNDIA